MPIEWFVERAPSSSVELIARAKRLAGDGWRVTVLVDYRSGELVAFGYLDPEAPRVERQLELAL